MEELKEISDILENYPELQPPFLARGDLISDFNTRVNCYLNALDYIAVKHPQNVIIKEVRKRKKTITSFSEKITETLKLFLTGNIKEAYSTFDQAITNTKMNDHVFNMTVPLTKLCNIITPLYRVRKSDSVLRERKDLFHIPFKLRHRVSAMRFSVSGLPCLYLGTSIFVCWQEMGKPDFDKLYISSFISNNDNSHVRILDLGYNLTSALRIKPLEFMFDFQNPEITDGLDKNYLEDETQNTTFNTPWLNDKISKLLAWPLVLACNYTKENPDATFNKEYIIPNLLMQWISSSTNKSLQKKISGIAYRSTKILNQKNSDIGINIIIPPQMGEKSLANDGFCPELKKMFKLTNPVSWSVFSTLEMNPKNHAESDHPVSRVPPGAGHIDDFDESLVEYYETTTFKKVESLIHQMMRYRHID
ncbi:hypothetical protein ACSN6U_000036 [Escherichia coli]|nr:hypothetical protein [Escherichia albertii]EHS3416289.1 hypothetical protein [Escherichia coli]EHS3440672.1 hypothetical protein [Escherichia coli]ELP6821992.1 hypothetical protein [Escherichia coli]MCN5643004.1 hypothetical protein [Escherichia coli]